MSQDHYATGIQPTRLDTVLEQPLVESSLRWLSDDFVDTLLDDFHEEVGARVLKRWNLPPLTHGVASRHHDIGIEDSPTNRMRNAVAIADAAADCAGESLGDRLVRLQAHDATLALEIPDALLDRLLDIVDSASSALS